LQAVKNNTTEIIDNLFFIKSHYSAVKKNGTQMTRMNMMNTDNAIKILLNHN